MIGYVMLGTDDIGRAKAFYDPLVTLLGGSVQREWSTEDRIWYAPPEGFTPMLVLTGTYDGRPATVGNGTMTALLARSRAEVDAVHARALASGGVDEGGPGLRGPESDGFYGAYFRDLDGHKLLVFRVGPG